MDVSERLRAAVLSVVAVCVPDFYDGDEAVYCTYNITENPEGFGDNTPHLIRHMAQLHLFLPLKQDSRATRRGLCRSLAAAGFTYPSVTNASDADGQHYVFEFEDVDGDV